MFEVLYYHMREETNKIVSVLYLNGEIKVVFNVNCILFWQLYLTLKSKVLLSFDLFFKY